MYDVDIIIPAYNSINTISIPLDSLKKQKTKYKFRVVIVNDNSSYSYKNILDKYSKYMFIEEIVLDRNGGPAVARQKGIDYTDSKYIMFIDSDDYLFSSDSIQKLVDNISLCNSDVAMGNFILERDNKEELVKNNSVWMHGKIYRRSFLEDNNIRFNTSRVNEDNGFNRLVVLLTKNISHLDEVVYVYKENDNSITRRNDRLNKFTGLEGYAYNMDWAFNEAKKRGVPQKEIEYHALSILIVSYYSYFDLKDKYDVSKILVWFKKVKDWVDINKFSNDVVNTFLESNRVNIDDVSKCDMSFYDYYNMI